MRVLSVPRSWRYEDLMGEVGYNTNLASEFYVMSVLYRLGLEPHLTLGNKKSVDIALIRGAGKALTIDVKAVAAKNDWLVGAPPVMPRLHHFVVLVSYEGRFKTLEDVPRCWVVPDADFLPLVHKSKTGSAFFVRRKEILDRSGDFEGAWALLMVGGEQA